MNSAVDDREAPAANPEFSAPRDCTSTKRFVSQTPVLHGHMEFPRGDESALADLVLAAMEDHGWEGVSRTQLVIKDTSGHGGSKTFKFTAEGRSPESIAIHCRSEKVVSDPLAEPRMEAASQLFSANHLAPCRIVQGRDWFIEPWEGSGEPKFKDDESLRVLGQFLANVHKLPVDWYDEWREQLCASYPFLRSTPLGCHVWFYAARPRQWLNKMPEDCRTMFFMDLCDPKSTPAKRLVTNHGDLDPGNMIQTPGGIKCIDLEFSCVSSAVMDLGHLIGFINEWSKWQGSAPEEKREKKHIFLRSYLQCMGDPHEVEDIDRVLLDAEIYCLICHDFSLCEPFPLFDGEQEPAKWKKEFEALKGCIEKIQHELSLDKSSPNIRDEILQSSIFRCTPFVELRMETHLKSGKLMLVPRDSPHRCVFENAEKLRRQGGSFVPLTLTSHPDLAITAGPLTGPHDECGCQIYHQDLGIGPATKALSVRFDGAFLHASADDPLRVFDVDDWVFFPGNIFGIWNAATSWVPPKTDCKGQNFLVNEDGTISPKSDSSLVLGASEVIFKHALQTGRLILVPSDSPHRCIFEHFEKLRDSNEIVPLTLTSHPAMAISKGPRRGPVSDCGYDIWIEQLGIGPASRAIWAKLDDTFLRESQEDSRRVFNIEDWDIDAGQKLNVFNEGSSFIPPESGCEGQRFRVNDDGTISPEEKPTLVLGASQTICTFSEDEAE